MSLCGPQALGTGLAVSGLRELALSDSAGHWRGYCCHVYF